MQLTAENVNNIFIDCLSTGNDETDSNEILGNGILHDFQFNRNKLDGHTKDIIDMLSQLPEQFMEKTGGGWSFLNMAIDKHGNQWAGAHLNMEQLLALGTAINKMGFNLPRDKWHIFPGGMPYVYTKK